MRWRASAWTSQLELLLAAYYHGQGYAVEQAGTAGAVERVQADVAARSASPQGQAAAKTTPVGPDLPSPRATAGQPVLPTSVTPRAHGRDSGNPCQELIDWQSGTYVDHGVPKTARREATAAERAELQRKADGSIRVLAPNTPELILE